MKTLSLDTPPEIEQVLIEGYRKMSAAKKLQIMQDLIYTAECRKIKLRFAGRRTNPSTGFQAGGGISY